MTTCNQRAAKTKNIAEPLLGAPTEEPKCSKATKRDLEGTPDSGGCEKASSPLLASD